MLELRQCHLSVELRTSFNYFSEFLILNFTQLEIFCKFIDKYLNLFKKFKIYFLKTFRLDFFSAIYRTSWELLSTFSFFNWILEKWLDNN